MLRCTTPKIDLSRAAMKLQEGSLHKKYITCDKSFRKVREICARLSTWPFMGTIIHHVAYRQRRLIFNNTVSAVLTSCMFASCERDASASE